MLLCLCLTHNFFLFFFAFFYEHRLFKKHPKHLFCKSIKMYLEHPEPIFQTHIIIVAFFSWMILHNYNTTQTHTSFVLHWKLSNKQTRRNHSSWKITTTTRNKVFFKLSDFSMFMQLTWIGGCLLFAL